MNTNNDAFAALALALVPGHKLEVDVSYSGLREHAKTEIVEVMDGSLVALGSIDFDHAGTLGLTPRSGEFISRDYGKTWELVEWQSSSKDLPTVLAVRYHMA